MEACDAHGRPTRLRVLALEYDVAWRDMAWFRSAGAMGQHDPILGVITVYEALSPTQTVNTLLHEVTHAIQEQQQLRHAEADSEQVANMVSMGIAAFLRDNPRTIAWIQELLRNEH